MACFIQPEVPRYMTVMRNGDWWVFDAVANATRAAGPFKTREAAALECEELEARWKSQLGS